MTSAFSANLATADKWRWYIGQLGADMERRRVAERPLPENWRSWLFGDEIQFDFSAPDYQAVFDRRAERLAMLRSHRSYLPALKLWYRENIKEFISDWGCTFDPRNVERGLPALIPFVLFDRQRAFVDFVLQHWRDRRPGLAEKSRDSGLSWLSVAIADSLCIFYSGMVVGFGSRKEDYVDKIGDPASLFWKARCFIDNLPEEFRGGWTVRDSAHMRIMFPETESVITGEAGDNIGRGNRTGLYVVDEAAFLERPQLIEASLSQTTNCRLDISTPNGRGNPFEQKRFGGKVDVFTFHHSDDPRKGEAWYARQVENLDPVTIAQEIDIDYSASVERIVIPHAWVMSAIDAHLKLGLAPSGERAGALDIADEGTDLNAFCGAYGFRIEALEEWSGKGGDIAQSVERAFLLCDEHDLAALIYDADGLGAGARGDARVINERRRRNSQRQIEVRTFRASGEVVDPTGEDEPGRRNKDFFANYKAQGWWGLRKRFRNTHRWVVEGIACDPADIISIPTLIEKRMKLANELAQPTFSLNAVGKIVIDKTPDNSKSPNLADAVMMRFARTAPRGVVIPKDLLERSRVGLQQQRY